VHPIFVFLAVIAGGELGGIVGVLFAIPALAVLRVLIDFFSVRVRTVDHRRTTSSVAQPVAGLSRTES
jgi:predicted PurR-regulated permease PerM